MSATTFQTANFASQRQPRALNWLAMLLYPFLVRGKTGAELEYWERCRALTIEKREAARIQAETWKVLKQEAKLFGRILVEQWARLGAVYQFRWRLDETFSEGSRARRRKRSQKVKFERVTCTPEALWFKIKVGHVNVLGRYISDIPHKVRVVDMISDESLLELSDACQRPVTARRTNGGVWVCVHRNGSIRALPDYVTHRDMLPHYPKGENQGAVIIGVGEHRTIHAADLESYPHTLVAGASGGGKSNFLNHFLCSLIRFHTADELKIILIDPKRLELAFYKEIPHLVGGIVYDVDAAIEILNSMVDEVLVRTELLEGKARKLSDYNKRVKPEQRLPRILITVEEIAALMRSEKEGKEVQKVLTQLANLGRAVGIHLLLCTQLPIVSVLPNTIKVSMWVRIAGRVQNGDQSRVIIGTVAAAKLPAVPGRMVYSKDSFTFEVQTPFVSDDDVSLAIRISKGRHLGWITLDGWHPIIHRDNFLRALVTKFARRVDFNQMCAALGEYGIGRRQVRTFIEELVKAGVVEIGAARYRVQPVDDIFELIPDNGEAERAAQEPPSGDVVEAEWEPIAQRRPSLPLPWLALPEPPPPPPPPNYREMPPREVVIAYLGDRVEVDWSSWTPNVEVHEDYCNWCKAHGCLPLDLKGLGAILSREGFKAKQRFAKRVRGWCGIRLKANDMTRTNNMSTANDSGDAA